MRQFPLGRRVDDHVADVRKISGKGHGQIITHRIDAETFALPEDVVMMGNGRSLGLNGCACRNILDYGKQDGYALVIYHHATNG